MDAIPAPSSQAPRPGILLIALIAASLVLWGTNSRVDPAGLIANLVLRHGTLIAWTMLVSPLVAVLLLLHWVDHSASHRNELRVRHEAETRARHAARQDALTGLLNRRGLIDGIEWLASAAHKREQAVALIVLDLDRFKQVNDLHGHHIGDALLREVAARLRECCPPEALIARIGGDEFAVAMEYGPQFPITIETAARALLTAVARTVTAGDLRLHVSASLGIAATGPSGWEENALLRQADVAMYRAKQEGRGCYRWFDESMEAELKRRGEIEAELRLAIPRGEIVPYYEPQIDFHTGRVSGVEVLARWRHPRRGLVPPDQFIAIAEDTGLIGELSFSVMEQALAEARDWDAGIRVAVNISPTQLSDPLLAQRLLKLLVGARFPAERLEIEITESALLGDMDTARAVITSLKNQGVRLALDDFGTGYSSLHHLRALPFDRIKIDRSFVSSILDNDESAAIVHAVLGLGESLGIEVVAEGIENDDIAQRLRELKCRNGQGYFYSRPVPGASVGETLGRVGEIVAGYAPPSAGPALPAFDLVPRTVPPIRIAS